MASSQNESPAELAKIYLTFAEIYAHAGMKAQAILYLHKAIDRRVQGPAAAAAGSAARHASRQS